MKDIEIARKNKLENIINIAKKINLEEDELEFYGKYKAKITKEIDKLQNTKDGKLILVTSINPTPLGEGKTTVSISIADALNKLGKNAILALREPSLGPVFGIKGGATGGGYSQVVPMEDINLHFTGDIHAITSANNLLASLIDNHIYFGNELKFSKVVWKRCLDLNDRQLREVETGLSKEKNIVPRRDKFDISVASEIMAILCLSENINDLKKNLGNIIIGYTKEEKPIFAKDLKAEGSMAVLLKDAIKPNLVQTLEKNPAIIHGGPFANIAHGCNSLIATKLALKLGDYVVTEAGFGADLGAEKFLDIKCRKLEKNPDIVVIVATIKALKYHGGSPLEDIKKENLEYLEKGLTNLYHHINTIKNNFGLNVVVAINKFNTDTNNELEYLTQKLMEKSIPVSISNGYQEGSKGAIDLASNILNNIESKNNFKFIYDLNDSIKDKILKIATSVYKAKNVIYEEKALNEIDHIEKLGYDNLPICIAKTQYSLSDNPKNLECLEEYDITIKDIELKNGAGFIVAYAGNIMTMPGLPKKPAAESININENNEIVGLF